MQEIIKSWFKYFIFVGFFGVCINLIYLTIPVYIMISYDRVLYSFSLASLYTLGAGVLISLLVMAVIDYSRARMLGQAGNALVQKMLPHVVSATSAQQGAAANSAGYHRGIHDLESLRNAIVQGHVFHILDLPWMMIYLGILYIVHPLIGVITTAAVLICAMFQITLRIIEKKRYIAADIAFQANADFLVNTLGQSDVVKGMEMLPAITKIHEDRGRSILGKRSGADALHAGTASFVRFFSLASLCTVFGVGAFVFFNDEVTAGSMFASVMIFLRLFHPLDRNLSDMKASIEAMAAYKRLKTFVNVNKTETKLSLPEPEGKYEVNAVSLVLNTKTLLRNISFSLEPGEMLGILGPSSAGKTSLAKLLLGIFSPTMGEVRLDGTQISQWPKGDLGQYVGYLPQETVLFNASVAQNISRLQGVDSEQVVKAAQKAGIHEMILKLPDGYDTMIDASGKNLSAGQRQLISIARAIYGNPRFVVFDEPHTHLDEIGLKMLTNTVNTLKQEKVTTVIVTDRSNLLMGMEKNLVIKDGQVALYGPGKEVLSKLANQQ